MQAKPKQALYIGLMSGTSIDGVDVALVDFCAQQPQLLDSFTLAYDKSLSTELHHLCQKGDNEINRMGKADRQVAYAFAAATKQLLHNNQLTATDIQAIGSHGQTIRHYPNGQEGFSLQIGDANTIAVETGIDVVADFRSKDIALGGQGAPLVPAFHQAIFSDPKEARVVLNIGGIANISYLAANGNLAGWDTGPGNTLLDAWCKEHTGQTYDQGGRWAAGGQVNLELLNLLLQHEYFQQPAPKSTGRETFHLEWLSTKLQQLNAPLPAVDIQATLLKFTVDSIARDIASCTEVKQVFICGGGAHNQLLTQNLQLTLPNIDIQTTEVLGVDVDAVEAMAFAWLAYAHKHGICGNAPSVTGARRAAVLGALFPK